MPIATVYQWGTSSMGGRLPWAVRTRTYLMRRAHQGVRDATTDLLADAGQEEGIFEPCDSFLVAYDLVIIAHMWALKHWTLGKRMIVHEFIQRQLDLFLRSLVKPGLRVQYLDVFAAPRLS